MSPACSTGLSRVGLLASALHPAELSKLNGGAVPGDPAAAIGRVDRTLRSNGVSPLLSSMPAIRGAGETAVLAGLVATVVRTLQVNLLAPNAASLLTTALQRACLHFPSIQTSLPRIPAPLLPGLTQLGGAALALKGMDVDLFSAYGVKKLESLLSRPSTGETLTALATPPLPLATANRLSSVASLSLAELSLSKLSGRMSSTPSARNLTASLGTLQSGTLSSLWPRISKGAFAPQIKLPDPLQVGELNAQKAALQLLGKSSGLDPRSPTFSKELDQLIIKFEASGACAVIQSNPIAGAQLEGLERLASFQSSLEATQQGMRMNLLEKEAGAKLARQVGILRSLPQPPAAGASNWVDMLGALTRLAHLGTAVS